MGLRLYSTTYCPYAWATRIVLHEKGVPFEICEVDLRNKPKEFLAVSPRGQVPVLVDGDLCLTESMVIAEYLEEKYPEPNLLGRDAREHALVRSALVDCLWVSSQPLAKLAAMLYYMRERTHPERVERALGRWHRYLDHLDRWFGEHRWLALDRMTLADVHLFPMVAVSRALGAAIGPRRPALADWYQRMADRPAVRRSIEEAAGAQR
ncbi:MAG: glutathione S-transferase family protein [Candidatus Dadabacteria bacterium]|nr:MAG: glutathione S-transferase family protein [Candidatus Dadabacteria bacterium]